MNLRVSSGFFIFAILITWPFESIHAQAKRNQVRILDVSAPGSPLEIGGKLSIEEEARNRELHLSFDGGVTGKNASQKRILALVARVNLSSSFGGVEEADIRYDMFFSTDLINRGSTVTLWHGDNSRRIVEEIRGPSTPLGPPTPTGEPTAKVQVFYAQFEDGSTYGVLSGPDNILQKRRISLWCAGSA